MSILRGAGVSLPQHLKYMNLKFFRQSIPPGSPAQFRKMSLILGVSVFLLLAIFQPFGTYTFRHPGKLLLLAGYGMVIICCALLVYGAWRTLFPGFFSPLQWTLGRELLFLLIVLWLCITGTFFYHHFAVGSRLSWMMYRYFLGIGTATALFPLALVALLRYQTVKNQRLQQQLQERTVKEPALLQLEGDNKFEKINFFREELLFIKASDNYVEIYLRKKTGVDRHLLRVSLSKAASQLSDEALMQVHRSYLVNLEAVERMDGKSPNYFLVFPNTTETVPVSRNKIQALRNGLAARPV